MLKYLAKRLLIGIFSLFIFMTVLFFILQVIIPGDFATQFQGLTTNPAEAERIGDEVRANLGLNLPLWSQYLRWLWNFMRGNLGISLYGAPVWDLLKNLLVATIFIFSLGVLIAFQLGQYLAELTFKIKSRAINGLLSFSAATIYSTFPPWLAFLVILILAGSRAAIVAQTYRTPLSSFSRVFRASQELPALTMMIIFFCLVGLSVLFFQIANRYFKKIRIFQVKIFHIFLAAIVSAGIWYILGLWTDVLLVLRTAIFPLITFILIFTGETMLVFRTNMLEVKSENFVLFAKATGEPPSSLIKRHIVRNSIFAVLSNAIISFPYIVTGLLIIERATGWDGMGTAAFFAFYNQEMPITMGILFIMGLFSLILRLLLDVIQLVLDPRLRRPSKQVEVDL